MSNNQNTIATLTETERNFLNNLFSDSKVESKPAKPFTAKVSNEP